MKSYIIGEKYGIVFFFYKQGGICKDNCRQKLIYFIQLSYLILSYITTPVQYKILCSKLSILSSFILYLFIFISLTRSMPVKIKKMPVSYKINVYYTLRICPGIFILHSLLVQFYWCTIEIGVRNYLFRSLRVLADLVKLVSMFVSLSSLAVLISFTESSL